MDGGGAGGSAGGWSLWLIDAEGAGGWPREVGHGSTPGVGFAELGLRAAVRYEVVELVGGGSVGFFR